MRDRWHGRLVRISVTTSSNVTMHKWNVIATSTSISLGLGKIRRLHRNRSRLVSGNLNALINAATRSSSRICEGSRLRSSRSSVEQLKRYHVRCCRVWLIPAFVDEPEDGSRLGKHVAFSWHHDVLMTRVDAGAAPLVQQMFPNSYVGQ